MCVFVYSCIHARVLTYTYTHTHFFWGVVLIFVVCFFLCVCVCVCVCVHVRVYAFVDESCGNGAKKNVSLYIQVEQPSAKRETVEAF